MTDTNAAETAAPEETKTKAPKAPKEPKPAKPQSRYWVGPTASREGAVYHRLQLVVAQNPGRTRDELIDILSGGAFAAKNSKKFEENPKQFVGGYLTAGERKGFFTSDESKALAAPNVATVAKKEAAEKGPSVTETGRALLNALRDSLGASFSEGNGVPLKDIAETLGKTKSQLSRTIDKLVKEKFVETDVVGAGDEAQDYIYPTAAGVAMVTEAAA